MCLEKLRLMTDQEKAQDQPHIVQTRQEEELHPPTEKSHPDVQIMPTEHPFQALQSQLQAQDVAQEQTLQSHNQQKEMRKSFNHHPQP